MRATSREDDKWGIDFTDDGTQKGREKGKFKQELGQGRGFNVCGHMLCRIRDEIRDRAVLGVDQTAFKEWLKNGEVPVKEPLVNDIPPELFKTIPYLDVREFIDKITEEPLGQSSLLDLSVLDVALRKGIPAKLES